MVLANKGITLGVSSWLVQDLDLLLPYDLGTILCPADSDRRAKFELVGPSSDF